MRDKDFPTDKTELANYIAANLARDLQISPDAAWGVVQRLSHESGLVAGRQETDASRASSGNAGLGGKGWAQWTGPRRQDFIAATKDNGGVMSPAANYQYLLADLKQNHPELVSALQDPGMTSAKANQVFSQGYEMGKGPYAAKEFKPVQIAGLTVPVQEAAAKTDPYDTLFDNHQSLPAAPAPTQTPAATPVPTPTQHAPGSDPYDNLFAAPTNAPATPAEASPDNPSEGKGIAAAVPQGSLGNDIKVGVGKAAGNLTDIATNPVGKMVFQPAAAVGTLAYNHIAPMVGGSALSPETVGKIVEGAAPHLPFGDWVRKGVDYVTGGNPYAPVAVPGVQTAIGAGIPGAVLGGLAGPGAFTGALMGTAGAGASNLAPIIARPEDEPGVATLLGAAGGVGAGRMVRTPEVPIRPYTAQTALEGQKAGGPEFRPGQLTTDKATQKADLRNNVDATNQQIQDFTKSVTKQAGLSSDEANSAWVDKLYDTAGKRLDTVAGKTGVTAAPELLNDVTAAKQAFDKSAQAGDPSIAAQGKRLVDNLLTPFQKGNGQITGKDYQDLTAKASELKTYARQGGQIGDLARNLLDALNNQLERGAKPEDVQEIRDARRQYATAKRLEPMVNDTTGLLDPTRVAREFGGDQGDMGAIARSGGLLPKPGVTGGVAAPAATMSDLIRTAGNRAALGALSGSGLIAFHDQALGLAHAMATNPALMAAAGGAATLGLLYRSAARAADAYRNRPAAQRAMITRAAMGLQGPPGANMLLPGVAGSEATR